MRFAKLSLERYGRFEDCQLTFRAGVPDLHIIYGPNEAGKTTSLSAVSDLLFGFPTRSPYNFLFDYALLRIGAELEENGKSLTCRRKKGTSGTLLDAQDAAMDDAPLRAMLRGQTRETFELSFSLNQDALRSGGRAMVEARDDLGRTLFAAGSGLTHIADEVKALESEADAIWGPQAAARRAFTKAQRDLSASTKAIRDATLKPKEWLDAKSAHERAAEALANAQGERNKLLAELSLTERTRRVAPLVRRRDEQLRDQSLYQAVPDIGSARETLSEVAIAEAEQAARDKAAADQLLQETALRKDDIVTDPAILGEADEIEQLQKELGAIEKGQTDIIRLEGEHAAAEKAIAALKAEAGPNADAAPTRVMASRLRDLVQKRAEIEAAKAQIAESRVDLEERWEQANDKLEATQADLPESLINAVDAARALGADADNRCEMAQRSADAAGRAVTTALEQLAPWSGTIDDLRRLPKVSASELADMRTALVELAAEIRREDDEAQRARDKAEQATLDLEGVATGSAVSPEDIARIHRERTDHWLPIRDHILAGAPLSSPVNAVTIYEADVAKADALMDRRYAFADASTRLSLLAQAKTSAMLDERQATARAEDARRRRVERLEAWSKRLATAALPSLEPAQFETWQAGREAAEAAHIELDRLLAEARSISERRDTAISALLAELGLTEPSGVRSLTPVLARAERKRAEGEETTRQQALARAEVDQIQAAAASLERRIERIDGQAAESAAAWTAALAEAQLEVDAQSCVALLDVIETLREATTAQDQLRRRIDGIVRDARDHADRVTSLANRLGLPTGTSAALLHALRGRLATAKAAANVLESLAADEQQRERQSQEATARLRAAEDALAPLMRETQAKDRAALTVVIERSRAKRRIAEAIAATEQDILAEGDGLSLMDLVASVGDIDPDALVGRVAELNAALKTLNGEVDQAATAHGDAQRRFSDIETDATLAADAAADAEQARSELEELAEQYILKRAQALTLKWAIEQYRERHQDPLLLRAGELFSMLTVGRYATLRVDTDSAAPRLLGLRDDLRTMVDVEHMSEGTTDQLFLALRLAALEQSARSGVNLPFLADDLFVNFDDERADAGFRVLAEIAKSTQVLFFTHHPHLVGIAKTVVGADLHSACTLA